MDIPTNLKYTKSHEWVRLEDDGTATIGITQHAQELLGDMVFAEIPQVGRNLKQGEECAVVESVKAAADVYAPISGEVTAVNAELESAPEKINQDAYAAWLFKVKPTNTSELGGKSFQRCSTVCATRNISCKFCVIMVCRLAKSRVPNSARVNWCTFFCRTLLPSAICISSLNRRSRFLFCSRKTSNWRSPREIVRPLYGCGMLISASMSA